MKRLLTGIFSLLLALSNTAASAEPTAEEALLGLRVSSKGITYYVYSGGCTQKSDFQVYSLESYPVQLLLVRTKPDVCKVYVPDGVKIFFRWDEVGLQQGMPFRVKNLLNSFTVPG
jgi:hypothetical protein